jgi:ribonucleoside-diphosphate reductase alpha chain
MKLNAEIFRTIDERANQKSVELGHMLGVPEGCVDRRHSHLTAVAPTTTNSVIAGTSPSIEPIVANAYTQKTAKGVFRVRSDLLEKELDKRGINNDMIWSKVVQDKGSVQGLDELDDHIKKVFLTAPEISQMALVRQAAQRQQFIDQSQSLNLFFDPRTSGKWINNVHMEAWKSGIKTLYYMRTSSILSADVLNRVQSEDCAACEG